MFTRKQENTAKKIAIGGVVVATIGYIAGILTAPKSGKETREDIKKATDKSIAQVEKELKKLHTDLDKILSQVKDSGDKMGDVAKRELEALLKKAKEAKQKLREVISAIHDGGADDKELDKAIKEANDSIEHLKQYLKKK